MSTAIINTDMNIGPFKIPGNGQNMIMNNYALRNNLVVELSIPEPFMSSAMATTQWIHKKKKLSKVILCSIHQLPKEKKRVEDLVENMNDVEFHFALENENGKGKNFLLKKIEESKMFMNAKIIDSTKTSWSELYEMMINEK